MQDRLKFRVWNKRTEEMFDVRLISYFRTGNICRVEASNAVGDIKIFDDYKANIEGIELMQCTGLKDKNGKLIYEEDIVRLFCDEFENIHTVKFGDFAMYSLDFQTEYEKGSTAVYGYYLGGLKYPIPLSISLDTSRMQIEVIGNIYENPELLEKQDD